MTTTKPNNQQKETNRSLWHKANIPCACAFIKRLCVYFILMNLWAIPDLFWMTAVNS
jgi:hypothetical protein